MMATTKRFASLLRRLGVEDLVNIHGPTRDVGRYWSAAHVGLMCSECEAFGLVTVEAMRAGLPVCGTNAGGTPEIIDSRSQRTAKPRRGRERTRSQPDDARVGRGSAA